MNDDMEVIDGSGNIFRDIGHKQPEAEHLKAMLAAKIIGVLDDEHLSVRRAHELTGFAAADFSRVRRARLSRFTIERLMSMLERLGQDVEIRLEVHARGGLPMADASIVG